VASDKGINASGINACTIVNPSDLSLHLQPCRKATTPPLTQNQTTIMAGENYKDKFSTRFRFRV